MKKKTFFALLVAGLLVPVGVVLATSASNIVVPKDEVINDNFIRVGQLVEIDGTVNGDLVVAAQTLVLTGTVQGDVIAAAQSIRIRGPVAGNLRLAGENVEIDSTIGKNVTVFAGSIETGEETNIGWSLQAFGSNVLLRGAIAGNAHFYGGGATVRAIIKGNANFDLGPNGTLTVSPPSSIGKNLTYKSNIPAMIDQDVVVGGAIEQLKPVAKEGQQYFPNIDLFLKMVSIFGALVVGLLILSFAPKTADRIAVFMKERPGASFGWGVIVLIVTPMVALLLLITIIGIPLTIIGLVLYFILLYATKVFMGLFIGKWFLGLFRRGKPAPLLWTMILGVILYSLLTWIPFVGWIVGLVGTIWALGAMVIVKRELLKTEEQR